MPQSEVYFFRQEDGSVPVKDWLAELMSRDRPAFAKCAAAIRRLRVVGHELRRPHADLLRDGIYELRVRKGRVNYRMLYFFHGRNAVVLAHGLIKEQEVPAMDIERALRRKIAFQRSPERHRAVEEI